MSDLDYGNVTVDYGSLTLRLGFSALLSAAVGLERELESQPAGLRTHILVGVGSAMFTLVSAYGFSEFARAGHNIDPSRIAAQVVSGIGFLGGGAIIKQGLDVRGLTTAASLWAVSAIGMAAALNYWFPALISTALILFTLVVIKYAERIYWAKFNQHVIKIECVDNHKLAKLVSLFALNAVQIQSITREEGNHTKEGHFRAIIRITLPKNMRSTPKLMLNLLRGVEALALSDVLLDGRNNQFWSDRDLGRSADSDGSIPDSEGHAFITHSMNIKNEADEREKKKNGEGEKEKIKHHPFHRTKHEHNMRKTRSADAIK
eukprot:TRINITY_DN7832_c0_g1_i1.p1 TRINITY_DN7832_c0_g1~~TRINITY_DN7832_c0_g1_i1.p1  ORF type:complete len:318 (-),score=30.29 TRINITY_DN7832_c0_g1_i1:68-1021(-)